MRAGAPLRHARDCALAAFRTLFSPLIAEAATLRALLPRAEFDLSPAAVASWPGWGGEECPCCGDFTGEGASLTPALCPACTGTKPPFSARSLFPYEGPAGEAIRAIKYGRRTVPAGAMADRLRNDGILGRWAALFPGDFRPVVVPVPILPFKYLRRGFNLPSLLGDALARIAGWRCDLSLLERVSEKEPQAGLHGAERRRNVESAFRTARRRRELPADVVLVDDVFTSGATAVACANALKRGGTRNIVVLTVARAVLSRDRAPENR